MRAAALMTTAHEQEKKCDSTEREIKHCIRCFHDSFSFLSEF